MTAQIDDTLRTRLSRLAAFLIPGDDTMPPADRIGLEGDILDRLVTLRPDIADNLVRAVTAGADLEPHEALRELERDDPSGYRALTSVIAGGYLMSANVKHSIGYPEQEERPYPDPGTDPDCLTDGMLEAVLLRGEIYRRV